MARRSHNDALGVTGADTIIGTGVTVSGDLASDGDIIIDGTLHGSIKTDGNVTLGVNAHITADIHATNVTVSGRLKGNITAAGEAVIRETGHVEGNIRATGLAITPGAVFMGQSVMDTPPSLDRGGEGV